MVNTNDSGPGSLRQAILDANANPGLDTIAFDIPSSDGGCAASGVCTIAPTTTLPTIGDPVIIDGYTQPGASPNSDPSGFNGILSIELSGANAGATNGLIVTAGGCTIRGLVINRFAGSGAAAGTAISLISGGGNLIEGNFIGTDPGGTLAEGNGNDAISIDNSNDNIVGGTAPAQRNVISANQNVAFFIATSGNVIKGNFIGTQKDGVSPLGNLAGIGFVGGVNAANNNIVGGIGAGEANVIAFNALRGVVGEANSGTGNVVRGNSIHDNGALGIDWVPVGPTPNDPGDADNGMNNYQNFPIIQSVGHLGPAGSGSTEIAGKLDSMPSTTFDLDFYSNPACSNFPREFLEGRLTSARPR